MKRPIIQVRSHLCICLCKLTYDCMCAGFPTMFAFIGALASLSLQCCFSSYVFGFIHVCIFPCTTAGTYEALPSWSIKRRGLEFGTEMWDKYGREWTRSHDYHVPAFFFSKAAPAKQLQRRVKNGNDSDNDAGDTGDAENNDDNKELQRATARISSLPSVLRKAQGGHQRLGASPQAVKLLSQGGGGELWN